MTNELVTTLAGETKSVDNIFLEDHYLIFFLGTKPKIWDT